MRVLLLIILVGVLAAPSFAAPSLIPKIANPGFEEVIPGNDAPGWGWHCTAQAGFTSDTSNPHSGNRCVVFQNESETAPEVYARLWQTVSVLPGTEYELSLWVRGENVDPGQHLTDWNSYTLQIPVATYGWQKITTIFTTKPDQGALNIGINISNKCKALAIDDIYLRPVGSKISGSGIEGSYLIPGRVDGDNSSASLAVFITSVCDANVTLNAEISAGPESLFAESGEINPGENQIIWEWQSGTTFTRNLRLSLKVTDAEGKVLLETGKDIEKLSSAIILNTIDDVDKRLARFNSLYEECRIQGVPLDYPDTCKTMLEQFIPLARGDVKSGELRRADFSVRDFNRSLDETEEWMRFYLENPKLAPVVRRYQTGKVDIEGTSFIADRKDSKGKSDRGPIFFCGYGAFDQVRKDMPRWPGYGTNIIQFSEFGPSAVLPSEDKISYAQIYILMKTLDDAAKHNVGVDFLISPHYFPEWPLVKWPHLGLGGGGWLGHCVDAPEAKQVIEQYLRIVIPLIKDKPALRSICLTNEPIFDRAAACYNTMGLWVDYLRGIHGDISTMNERYISSYKSFEEVPIPGGQDFSSPQFYDYCIFNKERFGGWHKWMADVIHEMAPNLPIHAKLCLILELPSRNFSTWGVDPEYFAHAMEINWNDCYYSPGPQDGWAASWQFQNQTYDLQRSMSLKPIFNSENHPTRDGSSDYVKPEHFRSLLWQGAIHGQGATAIWVWHRAQPGNESTYPFYGNVMDRPGCAHSTGTTCLDLNRFAEEVTALQNVKAPVAIVYSKASSMRDATYNDITNRAYAALSFCGVKIDFISERQLEERKGKAYRMIILPQATHLTEGSFKALCALPRSVRLVTIGEQPLNDQFTRPLPESEVSVIRNRSLAVDGKLAPEQIWPVLLNELTRMKALSPVSVVDARTGKPVWGVEWLVAKDKGRSIINIINQLDKPVEVKIIRGDRRLMARDLLTLGARGEVGVLNPITPVLAVIDR